MARPLNPRLGQAILRVVTGVIFVAHGSQKLFSEGGIEGTTGMLTNLGLPAAGAAAWLLSLLEFGGGLLLILGFLVTPIALLLSLTMIGAIVTVTGASGFFASGPGAGPQGGVEFNLILIAALLALVFGGPGAAAIDGRAPAEESYPIAGGDERHA